APLLALWVAVFLAVWLVRVWRRPPRLWLRVADGEGGRYLLWPWQVPRVRVVDGAVLVLPHARGEAQLRGPRAVEVLGRLLPELNAADCAGVDVRRALVPVRDAEEMAGRPVARPGSGARRRARRTGQASPPVSAPERPWECLVELLGITYVSSAPPVHRLALEMAVTEERERAMMRARAEELGGEWRDEEEIGRIADDLLLPEEITERLRALRDAGS
ncbi:MAG TPA: hypothetical protein VFY16_14225, partial [Gemmatimonadaceae bacterium]|nr:hypothetical protein [Gemmatimonadaceae bacterium]